MGMLKPDTGREAAEIEFPLLFRSASDTNDGVKKCLVGRVNRYKANKNAHKQLQRGSDIFMEVTFLMDNRPALRREAWECFREGGIEIRKSNKQKEDGKTTHWSSEAGSCCLYFLSCFLTPLLPPPPSKPF